VDRKALKRAFTIDRTPEWICPTCRRGILTIKKESFFKDELSHSRDHSHDAWEAGWIEYVFSCLLHCSSASCGEVVACTGTGSVDWDVGYDHEGQQEQVWSDYFRPKFFEPPLKIISIPESCPETVKSPLMESFRQLFSSPSASANGVRIALEHLLTDLKISRSKLANGKRRIVSLHERISNIPTKYDELKDLMLAVKWLGNAGSHDNDAITIDDVFDAYEMTEHVLHEIFEPKTQRLKAIAKKVNKRKGPA
jgi:Domain of unknown function (DUF4145)